MSVENQADTLWHSGDRTSGRVRRPWLGICVSILLTDYPTSIPVVDIATRLGRSKTSVYSKARRLGLRRPARENKQPDAVVVQDEARFARADNVRPLLTSADSLSFVNGQMVVLTNETPPPGPRTTSIIYQGEIDPRSCVTTRVGGRLSVWFPAVVERMMRLWLANVHHRVIGEVVGRHLGGRTVTAMAVQSKADRVGLPARTGITLIRDLDVASAIDRQAAPLPKTIRHQREPWDLRVCPLAGTPFYGPNKNRLSKQAKKTVYYRNCSGTENGMALAF